MDNEVIENLYNQNQGIVLGLSALAEQLQKMSEHSEKLLSKQEEDEEEMRRKEEEEMEKQEYSAMVKAIANEVKKEFQGTLESINKQLQDLGATKSKKVSGTKQPHSGATEEERTMADVLTGNKTESEAQKPIEAMEKQLPNMEEEELDEEEEFPMEEEPGADELPMEEETPEEEMEKEYSDTEVRNMARMIKELRKSVKMLSKSRDAEIKKEVETRLRKAGWREERGLAGPRLTSVGTDSIPIVKSTDNTNIVDRLSEMSWSDLLAMRYATMSKDPNELPVELRG